MHDVAEGRFDAIAYVRCLPFDGEGHCRAGRCEPTAKGHWATLSDLSCRPRSDIPPTEQFLIFEIRCPCGSLDRAIETPQALVGAIDSDYAGFSTAGAPFATSHLTRRANPRPGTGMLFAL